MIKTTPVYQNSTLTIPQHGMPVTIITGFLGSGKTTLLHHILTNNQDLKVAVLVNEFGDIDIDSQLLMSVEENMVALSNGCICCTINDSLIDAVYEILEREERIDYLVVETTGVADPLPIALTFISPELSNLTRVDSILTVVDTETFTAEHFESEAALSQIIYGDITILNKIDLVTEEKIRALEQDIHRIKEGARILHAQYGKVPLPLILDVGMSKTNSYADAELEEHHHHHHDHNHEHDHNHHHSDHLTVDGFMSFSFESDRPLIIEKFQNFLVAQTLTNVFRAKGILWFKESELRHIFQLSGKRYDIETDQWQGKQRNQLVFIGRNLDVHTLHEQLHDCLADGLLWLP